jgi:hypothetical protein
MKRRRYPWSWLKQKFHRIKYWFYCHLIERFHIINLSGLQDYKWGYLDADFQLEMACFKVLMDFVEKADPKVGFNDEKYYCSEGEEPDEGIKKQVAKEKEIREIYNWVKQKWHVRSDWDMKTYDETTQMLIRLMNVRSRLWS